MSTAEPERSLTKGKDALHFPDGRKKNAFWIHTDLSEEAQAVCIFIAQKGSYFGITDTRRKRARITEETLTYLIEEKIVVQTTLGELAARLIDDYECIQKAEDIHKRGGFLSRSLEPHEREFISMFDMAEDLVSDPSFAEQAMQPRYSIAVRNYFDYLNLFTPVF